MKFPLRIFIEIKMLRYVCLRILYAVPTLLFVSIAIFVLLRLSGTDPVTQYLINSNIIATPENIATVSAKLGLDKPILEQYWIWLKKAIVLDFGVSYTSGRSVSADFMYFLPNTLLLVACALIFTLLFSIPLGVVSAIYKDRMPDFFVRFFTFIGVSMPSFWLAFLLILFFSIFLEWLPVFGGGSFEHLILPTLSISLMSLCLNVRLIRTSMLEFSNERFVLYARMRGVGSFRIAIRHIFHNAILPIVTSLGMHIGELVGGALLIEMIFSYPGIGRYVITGISNNDYPIIQCFVLVFCFIFIVCNLCVDLFYTFLDPRLKKEFQRA